MASWLNRFPWPGYYRHFATKFSAFVIVTSEPEKMILPEKKNKQAW